MSVRADNQRKYHVSSQSQDPFGSKFNQSIDIALEQIRFARSQGIWSCPADIGAACGEAAVNTWLEAVSQLAQHWRLWLS